MTSGGSAYRPPEPLSAEHDVGGFSCGKPPLDAWLTERALRSEGRSARTFVVTAAAQAGARPVVAYYALATGSVARADVPRKIRHDLPNPAPVMVLARLAVDETHGGRGLGSALLRDAMLRTLGISRDAGVRALIVHAIDDEAAAFYTRYGFQAFPDGGRTLFLPIETLAQALGG